MRLHSLLFAMLLLSGCSTLNNGLRDVAEAVIPMGDRRHPVQEINNMAIDCINRDAQINFLEYQIRQNEELIQRKKITAADYRQYNSAVRNLMWKIRGVCQ